MADMGQLETALRNADAAGDVDAAKALAGEIVRMRSTAPVAEKPQRGVMDKLVGGDVPIVSKMLGTTGERFQTWPERLVRGAVGDTKDAVMLPGRVMQEANQQKTSISDSDVSAMSVPAVTNLAAIASPVSPASRAGEGAGLVNANVVKEKPSAPTAEALQAAAGKGYDAARNSGLQIKPEAVTSAIGQVRSKLEQDGIFDQLAPKTFAVIEKASNAPEGSHASIANLESLRRSLQLAARDFNNPTEQLAASRAIKGVDEFLEKLSPESILAGPSAAKAGMGAGTVQVSAAGAGPEEVAGILKGARGNYAAAQRSNSLTGTLDRANTGILERAQNRAQATASGRNIDNTIRQKVASLLEKPKEVSGFSDAELAALNGVVTGGSARNTAREISNLLGGGGGMGATIPGVMTGGAAAIAASNPFLLGLAAIPPATGVTSRVVANKLAKRSLNKADELVRSNSPLYREMLQNAPSSAEGLTKRAAIAKMLLMEEMGQKQQ